MNPDNAAVENTEPQIKEDSKDRETTKSEIGPLDRWSRVWPSSVDELMVIHKRIRRKNVFFSLFPVLVLFPVMLFSFAVTVYVLFFEIVLGIVHPIHYLVVAFSTVLLLLCFWLWRLSTSMQSNLYIQQSVVDRELNSL